MFPVNIRVLLKSIVPHPNLHISECHMHIYKLIVHCHRMLVLYTASVIQGHCGKNSVIHSKGKASTVFSLWFYGGHCTLFIAVLFQYRICAFTLVSQFLDLENTFGLVQLQFQLLKLQNPLLKGIVTVISENRLFSDLVQLWFLLVCSWIFQFQFPAQQNILVVVLVN